VPFLEGVGKKGAELLLAKKEVRGLFSDQQAKPDNGLGLRGKDEGKKPKRERYQRKP